MFPDEKTLSLCCWDSRNAERQPLLSLSKFLFSFLLLEGGARIIPDTACVYQAFSWILWRGIYSSSYSLGSISSHRSKYSLVTKWIHKYININHFCYIFQSPLLSWDWLSLVSLGLYHSCQVYWLSSVILAPFCGVSRRCKLMVRSCFQVITGLCLPCVTHRRRLVL